MALSYNHALGNFIHSHKRDFIVCSEHSMFPNCSFNLSNLNWVEVKYFDASGKNLNPAISSIPNQGGIYIFTIKHWMLPKDLSNFVMYVGRAHLTSSMDLRVRISTYKSDKRHKVSRMRKQWAKNLYVYYAEIKPGMISPGYVLNDVIDEVENYFLTTVLPPVNSDDKIPNKTVKAAVKAFR